MKEKYFVKDGSRNYFIAEANLKDGSSNFSNEKETRKTQKTLRRSVAALSYYLILMFSKL